QRKIGISVMMLVKNEEQWIATCLLSLNSFADEVIVVDNGSNDNTLGEISRIKDSLRFSLIMKEDNSNDFRKISNLALSLTSYNWIVRWGGDFIAYTHGKRNISHLREYLLSLNQKNYYLIYPLLINLYSDLFHVRRNREYHSESYIHSFHPLLKYVKNRDYDYLKVPWFYKVERILDVYFIHIGYAKPIDRIIYRYFWTKWRSENDFKKYPKIIDYIYEKSQIKWGTVDLKEIAQKVFQEQIPNLKKYDTHELGEYPDLLKPFLQNPKFRVIYKGNSPYMRSDLIGNEDIKIDGKSILYNEQ
ncbi:MAG: glycosyltransferase, partial [Candidatus Cloacimonadota bacterium]|nr:glycosyltransferase [Candidatus Cloacimonadota bacterium]